MQFSENISRPAKHPDFLATHDSATGMVMALSDFLKDRAFEGLGTVPTSELYAKIINNIPTSWRQKLYAKAGEFSAISLENVNEIDASEIDKWVYDIYPARKYPAIAIGSSNGALIHFCAAMGIPWLPQTLLIPVDKGEEFPVDEPIKTMEWAKETAKVFLKNNPQWHMMILSHGKHSVGHTQIPRWESLMKQAREKCAFIGTNPSEYPVDMAMYARYSKDLKEILPKDHPLPPPLDVEKALGLLQKHSNGKLIFTRK